MNALPEHRRALAGRTWSQSWSAASMDPISHYSRPISRAHKMAGYALALAIAAGIVWTVLDFMGA